MKRILIAIFLCVIPVAGYAFFGSGGGGGKKLPTGCSDSQIPVYSASTLSWSCGDPGAATMVYPGAGVALSTGSAWGTSLTVGTGNNNLVQLNASAQLPAVSGVNLTALNATNIASGTLDIARVGDGTVTLAKMANMATASILGRTTADAGVPEVLSKAGVQGLLSVDDLVTLSGVADGAVNLGTFTGSTITDNKNTKEALQLLETAVETKQDASTAATDAELSGFVGSANIVTVGTIGTGAWNATAIPGAKIDVHGTTAETTVADEDEVLIYSAANAGNRRMTKGNFVAGITSSGIVLDLADDGSNESTSVGEIAVTNDTNSVFSEPSANKLLVDASKAWPLSTLASTVTVADSTDATSYVAVVDSATGSLAVKTDAGITYNASTGALSATGINGILGGVTPAAASVTSLTATGTTTLATTLTGVLRADSGVVSADTDVTDIVAAGTESAAGKLQLASTAEVVTGSDTAKAVTAAGVAAKMAAPGTIGGTTPAAATFTDLTANGNTVIGNGDTDTATVRSLLVGGNSRAVQIAGSLATPTYATGNNELYVAGDIETPGTVYAAGFSTGNGTDTQRSMDFVTNTSFTPTGNKLYYVSDAFYFSEGGTGKTPMKLQDAQTATGVKTFQAGLYAGDASTNNGIRMYDGSSNYWTVIAPAGMSTNPTFKLPAAQGTSGQYLYDSDGAGTLAWGNPTATAHGSDTFVQFNDGGTALGSDSGFHYNKATNALTLGAEGASGSLIVYNELGATDYSNTLQPNAAQAGAATHTLPAATGTLLSTAAAITPAQGGTGVANGANNTITFTGNYTLGLTLTGNTGVTLPTTGTLATLAGTETLTNKTLTAPIISDGSTITFDESAADPNDADVVLSGADGVFKIAAANGANNETLTINLDSTANTAVVGTDSGVTAVDFGALNLVTTGNIAGGVNRIGSFASPTTSTGTYSLAAANAYNSVIFYNDTDTLALPAAVAGMSVCVYVTGTNLTTIDPNGTDVIVVDGTANAAGDAFTVAGAAGNFVCLVADAANHWITLGAKGALSAL